MLPSLDGCAKSLHGRILLLVDLVQQTEASRQVVLGEKGGGIIGLEHHRRITLQQHAGVQDQALERCNRLFSVAKPQLAGPYGVGDPRGFEPAAGDDIQCLFGALLLKQSLDLAEHLGDFWRLCFDSVAFGFGVGWGGSIA